MTKKEFFLEKLQIYFTLVIKIVTIPGFFLLNAMGTIISGVAIKKGYSSQLAKGRIITLALMIGIIIGYIIGNLIPLK